MRYYECVFIHRTYHIVSWRFTILLIEWDRTSASEGPSGCRYQFIFDLTHPHNPCMKCRIDHHTGNYMPYSFRKSVSSLTSPANHLALKTQETGPTVYSPYPTRLGSLTICWCNYKGSTFSSVILRPWMLVRPESNSRPPAWHDAWRCSTNEPPVGGSSNLGFL